MAQEKEITLAVISDLHCHEMSVTPRESFLLAGSQRVPSGTHPVQALIKTIRESDIKANVLLCPGDLANRASSCGMQQAREHLEELKVELQAAQLLTTLGNHDVDSRKKFGTDSFAIPRTLHPDFPVSDKGLAANFWAQGFYFIEGPDDSEFLVLNTVIGHTDESTAERGTFDHERISELEQVLLKRQTDVYSKKAIFPRIALMHHHPILHSSINYSSKDVLEFGDQLLRLLTKFGYRIIIHGHRHEPRITRQNNGALDYFVIASGSFSAFLHENASRTRNLFHLITIRMNATDHIFGDIKSWEFNVGDGWRPTTTSSADLPFFVGFSAPAAQVAVKDLISACSQKPGSVLRSSEIAAGFPDMKLLLPGELTNLQQALHAQGYKLVIMGDGLIESLGKVIP